MYIEGIVVAKSRKLGGYCLVIYEQNIKEFVRIISIDSNRHDGELYESECVCSNGHVIEALDVVKIAVLGRIKDEYQPENVAIDNNYKISYLGHVDKNKLIEQYGGVNKLNVFPRIFINDYSSMSSYEAKDCGMSFMFARVFGLEFYQTPNSKGEDSCKARFKYNRIEYNDVSVTISGTKEEDIRKYAGRKYPIAYVCFSFGHPYEGKCHKYLCSFLGVSYKY